jgi:hypothetical protein
MQNAQQITLDYDDCRSAIQLLMDADIPAVVYSNPGQGKTSMMKDIVEEEGPDTGLFEINCSLANQPDFMGWFYRCSEVHADYAGEDRHVEMGRYTYPYFLLDKFSKRPAFQFQKGYIVFEELGQTDIDLKRSLGQTFLEKRVGQHDLPREFRIVGLSNYQGGRDAVSKDFDFLINRRAHLHYQLGLDNFLVFAHRRKMLNVTMAFASLPQHNVFGNNTPNEQGPFLTPRSLETLDRMIAQALAARYKLDDPVVRAAASGIVGQGHAYQYLAFAALRDHIPSVAEIIRDPDGCRVPDKADQKMFVVFNMADAAEKKNIKQLIRYMNRLPSDMSVAFYRNALLRDKSLMSCSEFGDWAVANKTLLAIVNRR